MVAKLHLYYGLINSGGLREFNRNHVFEMIKSTDRTISFAVRIINEAVDANKIEEGFPTIIYGYSNFLGPGTTNPLNFSEVPNYEKISRELFSRLALAESERELSFEIYGNMHGKLSFYRTIVFPNFVASQRANLEEIIKNTGFVPEKGKTFDGGDFDKRLIFT
jgi:hypothetical protein